MIRCGVSLYGPFFAPACSSKDSAWSYSGTSTGCVASATSFVSFSFNVNSSSGALTHTCMLGMGAFRQWQGHLTSLCLGYIGLRFIGIA